MSAPKASSLTHQHFLAMINTLIDDCLILDEPIRILDAGCGNGVLMGFLHEALHAINPKLKFELYGFDVCDHGVQMDGFIARTIENLEEAHKGVDWGSRIRAISVTDPWPFENLSFDFVVSNQVMEHVHDKNRFFLNVKHALKDNAFFIALNPLLHCVHEGHIFLPWAHRIRSHSALRSYISFCSRLGIGKFPQHHKETGIGVAEYSERHADYMYFWTSYSRESETLDMAREVGLRASFDYSWQFYMLKIRQVFGLGLPVKYIRCDSGLFGSSAVKFLRYISSVTLVCHKRNIY